MVVEPGESRTIRQLHIAKRCLVVVDSAAFLQAAENWL
jgi:hypothetical protein